LGKGSGEGRSPDELMSDRRTVAEGAFTAPVLARLAGEMGIDMPVVAAVAKLLSGSANVDQVLVVTASVDPAPLPQLLDRLLVVAEANHIPAMVVVNKVDLEPATALVERFTRAGYDVIATSTHTGEGLDLLSDALSGRESVVTGPSGAGKSSLLNALEPGFALRIGAISERVRRGTHTTVGAVMLPFRDGFVVDTPGFSEVGLWVVPARGLAECFPEFREPATECRFGDCRHRAEPGCAVLDAVAAGVIDPGRHASYLAILAELEGLPKEWE